MSDLEDDIPLIPVSDSKSIDSMGYDQSTNKLRVKFKNGQIYDHEDVPLEKYAALTGARSTGSFYNRRIRSVYISRKLK
jgi:hypothetical protein